MRPVQTCPNRLAVLLAGCLVVCLIAGHQSPASAAPGDTTVVSLSRSGKTGAKASSSLDISDRGDYVLFASDAPNVSSGDMTSSPDVFLFETATGATRRVPVFGAQGQLTIHDAALSGDGRFVVASVELWIGENLDGGIIVYDRLAGVGTTIDYNSSPDTVSISDDGRFVTYGGVLYDRQSSSSLQVDVGLGGAQANGYSRTATISGDGNWVAFSSTASNLVAADTNGKEDVFVYNRLTGNIYRASRSTTGVQGNLSSDNPSISANGQLISYSSNASNLVPGDTNGVLDIFVWDNSAQTTARATLSTGGVQSNGLSGSSSISGNGRYIAFRSKASNLVTGDTNGVDDVFVHDRQTGTTTRASLTAGGSQGTGASGTPSISYDGRFVAFGSWASNLSAGDTNVAQDVFLRDRQAGTLVPVSRSVTPVAGVPGTNLGRPALSGNANFVAFGSPAPNLVSGDTNGVEDVFVRDTQKKVTTRVSISSGGKQSNAYSRFASISDDGRFVAFYSIASNLVTGDTNKAGDIFVRDRQTSTTARMTVSTGGVQGSASNEAPAISGNGRFVAFASEASNLVSGDTNSTSDVFVRDRQTDTTTRVSVSSSGVQGNSGSREPAISSDGRFVAFASRASNLVPGDSNGGSRYGDSDIFVRDRQTGVTSRVSLNSMGQEAKYPYFGEPAISADGRYVAFSGLTTLLNWLQSGVDDTNLFVHDRQTGVTTEVFEEEIGGIGTLVSGPSFSADGRYMGFSTIKDVYETTYDWHAYVYDRQTETITREDVTQYGEDGNRDAATGVAISGDGRFVAFVSGSTNLAIEPVSDDTVMLHERLGLQMSAFSLAPSSLAFGSVKVGVTSAVKSVTVTNTGPVLLPIMSISIGGTSAGQFSQTNECPTVIPVAGKCIVSVKFKPTAQGAKAATVTVTPGGGAAVKTVALSGTGI